MKTILAAAFIMAAYCSCAQQRLGIEKIYAFRQLRIPGNIPVDDQGNVQGNGPDTVTYIYIETTGGVPQCKRAVINGKVYEASAALIDPTPVEIGRNEHTGQLIVLGTGKGNKLWQVTLSSADLRKAPEATPASPVNGIMLEGTYQGKPFKKVISNPVTLQPRESV